MSQLDKLTFLPNIFWFVILLFFFYFVVFSSFLPIIFTSLKVRSLYFEALIKIFIDFGFFAEFCIYIFDLFYYSNYFFKIHEFFYAYNYFCKYLL